MSVRKRKPIDVIRREARVALPAFYLDRLIDAGLFGTTDDEVAQRLCDRALEGLDGRFGEDEEP